FEELAKQVIEFKPSVVGLSNSDSLQKLKAVTSQIEYQTIAGEDEISDWAGSGKYDLMLAAIVGFSGLKSVLSAVKAGKRIALANKESLVAAGELVLKEAKQSGSEIIPVDSEHSAIFQLINSKESADLKSVILTASGGPFLHKNLSEF